MYTVNLRKMQRRQRGYASGPGKVRGGNSVCQERQSPPPNKRAAINAGVR